MLPNFDLGTPPLDRVLTTIDELHVNTPVRPIFEIAREVEHWPAHLSHYRFVRFRDRSPDGGGLVEMSANRPFGLFDWPTWWLSEMAVNEAEPWIRFRHVQGITMGMDVEWTFSPSGGGTLVRIVHTWNGPSWPLIGELAALNVIGPVFVHGIASRTLAGLKHVAER